MAIFIDTSAIYAVLAADDHNHALAVEHWDILEAQGETLVTSNYVLLESSALIGRRLGLQAVRDFQTRFTPVLEVEWVDKFLHDRAMAVLLAAGRRDLSLVDCVSFELMRQRGLDTVFAFDAHFADQGFHCVP